MNHKTDMREALQLCIDAMLHDGVPTDPYHPRQVALTAAEAALACQSQGVPVAWQVRRADGRIDGVPIQWECCTKELYETTLATGRYAGYENGPLCEVRALFAAAPAPVSAPSPDREQVGEALGLSYQSCALLLNVLWHHQGGSSTVGQPIRAMLGIGQYDHLTEEQLSEAKRIEGMLAWHEAPDASPSRECGERQGAMSPERFIADNLTASERADGRLMNLIVLAWEASARTAASAPTPSGQCVHTKGIIGDEGGTPCCPITMTPDASAPTPTEPAQSPTSGMTLGERIAHVGGRTNAAGYVEFGSPMAVDALIRNALRDAASAPTLSNEQINLISEKWSARWSTGSAWNTKRCIDNALREACTLIAASAPTPEALAANQCVHAKGILGDEGGTPCCPITMTPDASAPTLGECQVNKYCSRVCELGTKGCETEHAPSVPTLGEPKLAVWYGPMPESNGKTNWTAILHKGDIASGMTIDRSEYPDRVRYEADRVRWLIGELADEPFIPDYDADKNSGYVAQQPKAAEPKGITDEQREIIRQAANCLEFAITLTQDGYDGEPGPASEWDHGALRLVVELRALLAEGE